MIAGTWLVNTVEAEHAGHSEQKLKYIVFNINLLPFISGTPVSYFLDCCYQLMGNPGRQYGTTELRLSCSHRQGLPATQEGESYGFP